MLFELRCSTEGVAFFDAIEFTSEAFFVLDVPSELGVFHLHWCILIVVQKNSKASPRWEVLSRCVCVLKMMEEKALAFRSENFRLMMSH